MAKNVPSPAGAVHEPAFPLESVRAHLERCAAELDRAPGYDEIAAGVDGLLANLAGHFENLEELDQRLTALEDKMAALARTRLSDEDLFQMRRELDSQLRPYRSRMTADQLVRLEKSFLDRKVYDHYGLPRLSLFYMG